MTRSRRCRQRHAGHTHRHRRSQLRPMSTIRPTAWQAVRPAPPPPMATARYALDAAGVWTYTLDNSNADGAGAQRRTATLTDSFTALTADGTAQVVTITITGANDAAVISGDTDRRRWRRPAACTTARPARPSPPAISIRPTSTIQPTAGRQWQPAHATYGTLQADGGRGVDLHARQQQSRRAGAQRRRHARPTASRR